MGLQHTITLFGWCLKRRMMGMKYIWTRSLFLIFQVNLHQSRIRRNQSSWKTSIIHNYICELNSCPVNSTDCVPTVKISLAHSNPDACERSLASHAVYTLIQCTPLLVEKAGVAPEVNLRNPLCTGEEAHKRGNPPWHWNPGQTSPEVHQPIDLFLRYLYNTRMPKEKNQCGI